MTFDLFGALAEFERNLIRGRAQAGLGLWTNTHKINPPEDPEFRTSMDRLDLNLIEMRHAFPKIVEYINL